MGLRAQERKTKEFRSLLFIYFHDFIAQKTDADELENTTMTLLLKNQSLIDTNEQLKQEISELGQDMNEAKILAQNFLKLQCDLQDSQLKYSNLQKDFQERCEEHGFCEARLEEKSERIQQLQKMIDQLHERKENMAISQFMITKNQEIEHISLQIEGLTNRNQELEKEVGFSRNLIAEYQERLSSLKFPPDSEHRKSKSGVKEPTKVSLLVQEADEIIKQQDPKRAALRGLFPKNSENLRRGTSFALEISPPETENALKRGSAMMTEKDIEILSNLAKKKREAMGKKRKVPKREMIRKDAQTLEKNSEEKTASEKMMKDHLGERKESRLIATPRKGSHFKKSFEEKPGNKVELLPEDANKSMPLTTEKKDEGQDAAKQASGDSIQTNSTKLTPPSGNIIPNLPKKHSIKKEAQRLKEPKILSQSPSNSKSPIKEETPPKKVENKLNKTGEISKLKSDSKPGARPNQKKPKTDSSHQNSLQAEKTPQSLSKAAIDPSTSNLKANNLSKFLSFKESSQSSAKVQRKLNDLLSEKTSNKSLPRKNIIAPTTPFEKLKTSESEGRSTFFTPSIFPGASQKNGLEISEPMKSNDNSHKSLSFFSIPNIIHFTPNLIHGQNQELTPENPSKHPEANKLPSLALINSTTRLNSFKSKINTMLSDQKILLTESSVKHSMPDFFTHTEDLFPTVSTKNARSNLASTKSFKSPHKRKVSRMKENPLADNEKIRSFFQEETKSFFQTNAETPQQGHRRNYSDHQLQLLRINFSRVKEKEADSIPEEDIQNAYEGLQENERNSDILMEIRGYSLGRKPEYHDFREFVRDFERKHEKCGQKCPHLVRFLEKLGFRREKREVLPLHRRNLS